MKTAFALATLVLTAGLLPAAQPPPGFTALFNGRDLTGWRGGTTFDHRKLLEMPEAERAAQIAKWTATMTELDPKSKKPNWHVEGDPTEGALLTLAIKTGIELASERAALPRTDAIPFESEHRFMATHAP